MSNQETAAGSVGVSCDAGCAPPMRPVFELAGTPVWRCATCGLYRLAGSASLSRDTILDRSKFDDAFRDHRLANYGLILDELAQRRGLNDLRVLDVGCSSGWFLEAASQRGCRCFGIEPDEFFFDRASASLGSGASVVHGFFDADLPDDWAPFDLITFHDVFEHLEDPASILRACASRLKPDGLLLLSVPSADGFVFQIGRALRQLGYAEPMERMFQVHYPFPHLYYFTPYSLQRLVERAGFDVLRTIPLPSFSIGGAVGRAAMDRAQGTAGRLKMWANAGVLVGFALLQPLFPADNIVVILQSPHFGEPD